MNWEDKFSSIISETESNLHRVKEKLQSRHIVGSGSGNQTYSGDYLSTRGYEPSERRSLSMIQYPVSSTPKTVRWNAEMGDSFDYKEAQSSSLHSKLEQQNRTIDQLNNLVRVMEKERDEHKLQINELKYEIRELSKHVTDRHKEEGLQRQITMLKNDISKEVDNIRDQVQSIKSRHDTGRYQYNDDTTEYTSNYTTDRFSNKEISDLRQLMRDEFEYVRTDIDGLKQRIGVMEAHVHSNKGDSNSLRLTKVMDRLSDNRRLLHETRDIIPSTIADKSLDKYEMAHIRSNVSLLKDKLDRVEEKLQQSLTKQPLATSYLTHNRTPTGSIATTSRKSYNQTVSCDIDDLYLSDDKFDDSDELDSDIDDIEEDGAPDLTSTRRRKVFKNKTVDDLDLELMKFDKDDDGDLSDDELDDILDNI